MKSCIVYSVPGSGTMYVTRTIAAHARVSSPRSVMEDIRGDVGAIGQLHTIYGTRRQSPHPWKMIENFYQRRVVVPVRHPRDVLLSQLGKGMSAEGCAAGWMELMHHAPKLEKALFLPVGFWANRRIEKALESFLSIDRVRMTSSKNESLIDAADRIKNAREACVDLSCVDFAIDFYNGLLDL